MHHALAPTVTEAEAPAACEVGVERGPAVDLLGEVYSNI